MAQATLAWSFFIVNTTTIRLKSYSLKSPRVSDIADSSICAAGRSELSLDRRRIELGDFRQAVFLRDVRAGDEGAADLGGVPARHDAEAQRLFGFDVTRGKNLHVASLGEAPALRPAAEGGFGCGAVFVHRDAAASAACASARSTELMESISVDWRCGGAPGTMIMVAV